MKYLPAVSRAEYRGDFRILVTFSDGSENTIDFQQWLEGPMFDPLKNGRISSGSSWMAGPSFGRTVRTSHLKRCTKCPGVRGGLRGICSRRRRGGPVRRKRHVGVRLRG